ncbi:hypothetical protein BKA70DRAFT_18117 [Coprinopsis sp. MPI-PUGE-AT-0042]|nr:hypothetical protein BKA70DRAFT_18117 [Coprinopsis sp. MPI-PUGE-AT-0042]
MPPSTLQSRISAFESLAGGSSSHDALNSSPPSSPKSSKTSSKPVSLIDTPLSAAGAVTTLTPVAGTGTKQFSPSPSPPNLGRKTSLIDLADWIADDDPVLVAPPMNGATSTLKPSPLIVKRASMNGIRDGRTPTQKGFNSRSKVPPNAPLINLDSPPSSRRTSAIGKAPPPLPPRKSPSYNSLRSIASNPSSPGSAPGLNGTFLYPPRKADTLSVDPPHAYPPSPRDGESRSPTKHAAGSSISSFHSVSLSSDTDASTPNSLSNFIASYPGDHASEDSVSISDSYENVSASASPVINPPTITLDLEKARARRNQTVPPQLPKRPTSTSSGMSTPSSARSSMRSPPPLPPSRSSQTIRTSGSSTPRSIPGSPINHPSHSSLIPQIPTTYAVRRPPPPPPSRGSDRSSVQSTFSISSTSNQSHRGLSRTNTITSISSTASSPRGLKQRPTPVPTAARKRYEAVFNGNVIQRRRAEKHQRKLALMKLQGGEEKKTGSELLSPGGPRSRRSVGWRGLSVDLVTGDPNTVTQQLLQQQKEKQKALEEQEDQVDEFVSKDERLEGAIVRMIWKPCGLDKRRLADIWNECDYNQTGSLDLDSFVKGMWRIDEELRRTQLQSLKSASSVSLASLASKKTSLSRQSSLLSIKQGAPSSFRPIPPSRILLR